MRFSVDWIDGGVNRAAEERATLCELGIDVAGRNACRFIDYASNEETDSLIVPAVHLAEGLAADWWIIFGGRDRDHNSEFAECWSRVIESRNDPDEQAFCEAAGALGLDPYSISDDAAVFIEDANDIFPAQHVH